MLNAGWIAAGLLAALIVLGFVLRKRLLAALGYELWRIEPQLSAHEELRGAVDELHREGGVVKQDRDRVGALLDLHEMEVSDVMVHRTNMRSVNADNSPEAVVREILGASFLEEHTLRPVDAPAPLDSLDD